jgi:hypothetical protein
MSHRDHAVRFNNFVVGGGVMNQRQNCLLKAGRLLMSSVYIRNVRFPPIADISQMPHSSNVTAAPNSDVSFQRRRNGLGMIALLVLIGGIAGLAYYNWSMTGRMVEGRIVALGSVPIRMTGDQPIITVELADGTMKQTAPTKWALAGCEVGSRISLVQRGGDVRVGVRGCRLD